MKRTIILTGLAIACLLYSCSKSKVPQPSNNNSGTDSNGGTNNGSSGGNNNGGTTNPSTGITLTIDPSFKALAGFSGGTGFEQSDGKIILSAGYLDANNIPVVGIYRLNTDGTVDSSFNIDVDKTWLIKSITGLFVLADGKILVGGEFTVGGKRMTIIRLTSTGALDYSYISPVNSYLSVAFQRTADAKVFVSYTANGPSYFGSPDAVAGIIRLNSDGSLDNSFSLHSFNVINNNNDSFTSIVPLVNGKIFVAGIFSIGDNNNKRQNVARLNADGSVDLSFNFNVTINSMATIRKTTVQSNGKVIIAGNFTGFTDPSQRNANYSYYGLARLNTDGTIDQSFKSSGGFTFSNYISDIELLSDDRIFATWLGIYNGTGYGKNYLEFFAKEGGIDNSLTFPYQYNSVTSIFKESADRFLLIGNINIDGVSYPVVRYKK